MLVLNYSIVDKPYIFLSLRNQSVDAIKKYIYNSGYIKQMHRKFNLVSGFFTNISLYGKIMENTNLLIKNTSSQIWIQNNDNNSAVMLIHGFRVNPNMFLEISNILYEHGFSIYNLRLPGHGCIDKKMINKTKLKYWEIWIENFLLDLIDKYKNIYLIGASLGATLILEIAKKYNKNIARVILITPLLRFKQPYIFITGVIKFFLKEIKREKNSTTLVYDFMDTFYKFYPVAQLWEFYKLTKKVTRNIDSLNTKVLCILCRNDEIVDFKMHERILRKFSNFDIRILEKSQHNAMLDIEKNTIINIVLEYFNEK